MRSGERGAGIGSPDAMLFRLSRQRAREHNCGDAGCDAFACASPAGGRGRRAAAGEGGIWPCSKPRMRVLHHPHASPLLYALRVRQRAREHNCGDAGCDIFRFAFIPHGYADKRGSTMAVAWDAMLLLAPLPRAGEADAQRRVRVASGLAQSLARASCTTLTPALSRLREREKKRFPNPDSPFPAPNPFPAFNP